MTASSRTVEHVGEWRVDLRADGLEEIFRELARVIARAAGPADAAAGPWEEIELTGRDVEGLLVDFANELVSRSEIEGRAYDDLRDVVVSGTAPARLRARVRGRPVRTWLSPLKAATYHGVRLYREGRDWRASLLFDV